MCGVVGILAFDNAATKEEEKLRQESMIYLGSELLEQTQSRGKDATGVAALFDNCDYMLQKMGIPAQEFIARFGDTEKDFEGFLKIWRRKKHPARMFVGHCRKSSVGNTDDNANNHPIKVGDIVGIHNGTLTNHEKIFKKLDCKRDGKVDSEAIFRLIHHLTKNGTEPYSKEVLLETCKRLHGTYCCLTFSGNNPYQMAAFRDGRPLEMAIIRPLKLAILASDQTFIKKAIYNYNKMAHLYVGSKIFKPLKKDDVDIKFMADDSIYLFDLRKEITKDTDIADLYETEKVPRTGKVWDNVVKKTYNNNTASAKNTNTGAASTAATGKKSQAPASSDNKQSTKDASSTKASDQSSTVGGSQDNKAQSNKGRVWNSTKSVYDVPTEAEVKEAKKIESVELNTETGEVKASVGDKVIKEGEEPNKTFTEEKTTSKFGLKDGTEDTINKEPTSTAKINQINVKTEDSEIETHDKEVTSHLRSIAGEGTSLGKTEVNMKTPDPKILERSNGFANNIERFSNNIDICNFLEIPDSTALKDMPLPALLNRVQKKIASEAWYKGYTARMIERGDTEGTIMDYSTNSARSMFGRLRNKKLEAEGKIRQLKHLVKLLSEASGVGYGDLERFVSKSLNRGDEITDHMLLSIFKPGDLRDNKVMRNLVSIVQSKEGR